MKKIMTVLLCLCMCFQSACAEMVSVSYAELIACLANAYMKPSEEALAQIDREVEEIDDTVARSVAEYWKEVWLDPEYRLFIYGEDDPVELPVTGRHAFVVLGYQLKNGEMTEELVGRCNAAAAAAYIRKRDPAQGRRCRRAGFPGFNPCLFRRGNGREQPGRPYRGGPDEGIPDRRMRYCSGKDLYRRAGNDHRG